jgi:hypothetical protein
MKMTLKKRIASTLAVGAIAIGAMLAAPVAANATANPSRLDQGDLSLACKLQYGQNGWIAQQLYGGVYGWRCVYNNQANTQRSVDVNNYCMTYFGTWSTASPGYWKCQGY